MNGPLKLTLLSATLLFVGCNEKVSPELQDAASSATVPPPVAPSEYYFKLENTASPLLNYQLHKTGAGNFGAACEIKQSVPLTNSLYSVNSDSDISCFMETEELALFFSGLSFKVSASPNTCEYIGYEPFSYYNRMPGDSSTTLFKFTCDATLVTPADILNGTDGSDTTDVNLVGLLGTAGNSIRCNEFLDRTISAVDRQPFTADTDEDLCRFKYKNGDEENCDIGQISITEINLTKDTTSGDVTATTSSRLYKCGGKAINCVRGPIMKETPAASYAGNIWFQNTNQNEVYTKQYDYPGLIEISFPGTYEYANYRRDLASLNVDFGNAFTDPTSYIAAFGSSKDFTPTLMDRYSNNRRMNGAELITTSGLGNLWDKWSYIYDDVDPAVGKKLQRATPLAAEPFLGIGIYGTNPFYTFYCLDSAYDIKARIRMVVRDWDRIIPSNDKMEYISDIGALTNSRQDVLTSEELPDDGSRLNWYNDKSDWDDLLMMERTTGAYAPGTTIWRPAPKDERDSLGVYWPFDDGFFNPRLFPSVYTVD